MAIRFQFIFLIFLFVFVFYGEGMAQDQTIISDWKTTPNITIKTFDQDDGLPVVSLTGMTFGADNHLYVGSFGGLARFNGTRFELISSEEYPELPSNRIINLKASPDSSIWVMDEKYRLARWKAGKVEQFPNLTELDELLWWDLKFTPSGITWVINDQKIYVYDKKGSFENAGYASEVPPIAIEAIDHERAWVLNQEGLYELKNATLHLLLPAQNLPSSTPDLTRLIKLENGKLLIMNFHYVAIYDPQTGALLHHTFEGVQNKMTAGFLAIDSTHFRVNFFTENYFFEYNDSTLSNISVAHLAKNRSYDNSSFDNRVFSIIYNTLFDHTSDRVIFDAGTDTEIRQMEKDTEGNLWISTDGEGLKRISVSRFQVVNSTFGLAGDNAYSITEHRDGSIWLETLNAGINRISGNRIDHWTIRNSGNPAFIRSIYATNEGTVFASFYDSLFMQYNGERWSEYVISDSSTATLPFLFESFYEDYNQTLWLGSNKGLIYRKSGTDFFTEAFTEDGHPIHYVRVISEDPKKRLWFGTNGSGLYRKKSQMHRVYPDSTFPLYIRDIFAERTDTLWLATETQGLTRVLLDEDGQVISSQKLTKKDGLPHIGIHRILADANGYFWLTSNQGISRVHESQLNNYLDGSIEQLWIQNFTEDDGLPIREMNGGVQSSGLVASDSTIWVPSQKGVIYFDPASFLNDNPYTSTEINVSKIKSTEREYPLYGENSFTVAQYERTLNIMVSLLHYSSPENLSVEYEIPTLRTGWQALPADLQFSMTNIPPGIHQVNMRLTGVPELLHPGTSFALTVPPYFYEKPWFKAVIGTGIAGFIIMGFLLTIRASKRREKKLNAKVVERTHLLEEQKSETEKALAIVQNQASELKKLNKVKTDFFINITHELRTPLTLIKGPLGLLKEATENKKSINREEQLGLIERNSNRLNNLVDHLLNLLRMETGQIKEEVSVIDLKECTAYLAAQFESSEELRDKHFNVHSDGEMTLILADPNSLESIISNLLSNAGKYTKAGDHIDLYTGRSNSHVFFEVRDTGIGISPEDQAHIFDPFFRSGRTNDIQGSGIGLSVVKSYMNQIGGEIQVDSELGEGTSVKLLFPVPNKQDLENLPRTSFHWQQPKKPDILPKTSDFKSAPKKTGEATILVVDDNQDLRIFFSQLLDEYYTVITAENGEAALEIMENQKPDLILSDVMMPGIDGIELVRKIRSRKKFKLIPVIILSAKKTDLSITEGLKAGAQVYLTKPVDNQVLLAQIQALISREIRINNPDSNAEIKRRLTPAQQNFSKQVDELILRHLSDPTLTVQGIADALYISESTLYRKWKKVSEYSLNEHIVRTRLQETIMLIEQKGLSFTEASSICGFSHLPHFSKVFKKYYHTTPTEYFKTNH